MWGGSGTTDHGRKGGVVMKCTNRGMVCWVCVFFSCFFFFFGVCHDAVWSRGFLFGSGRAGDVWGEEGRGTTHSGGKLGAVVHPVEGRGRTGGG